MSGNPSCCPIARSVVCPPGGTHSCGAGSSLAGPNDNAQTHGTTSPQWSRWKCVRQIASTCGQSSCSRSLARTPAPQSSNTRFPSASTRYPDCAPPGLGHAGEQPTTVSFICIVWPIPGRTGGERIFPRVAIPILRAVAGKIRVVIAKPGLDGHDRGAKIIARALRDAGMEVIYTGLHQTPEQIVETAIQEDADAVGISILSGAHMTLVPKILEGFKSNGVEDVVVVVGGTIPKPDVEELKRQGVAEVFTPGAPLSEIVDFLRERVPVTR